MKKQTRNHGGMVTLGGIFLRLFLALLLLNLSGCTDRRKAPAGQLEKLTFAYVGLPISALFIVAQQKGFFGAEGVEVTPQRHEYGKPALRSVLDGKADLATVGDTPVMFAVSGGAQLRVLAVIATSEKSEAIVARTDRGISSPEDLKGKTIGVTPGTTGEFFLESFLEAQGMRRRDIVSVDLKPDEMSAALMGGRVDAVATWQPVVKRLQSAAGGGGTTFFDETIYSEIMCVAARPDFVRNRPATVRKVLKGLVRAEAFMKENPAESRRLVAAFIGMDDTLVEEVWKVCDFRATLSQALLVSLENQAGWARRSGRIGRAVHPNFLDSIHIDGLLSVRPGAVRMIR